MEKQGFRCFTNINCPAFAVLTSVETDLSAFAPFSGANPLKIIQMTLLQRRNLPIIVSTRYCAGFLQGRR